MKYLDDLVLWVQSHVYRLRAVVPGVVNAVATSNDREQMIDVQSATPDLVAGEAAPTDITPDTPLLNMTSGGFYVLMPVAAGDEVLGLCADRATGDWITTRTPGQVAEVNGARAHVLSDMLALPMSISAPSGAPTTWSGLVIGGPEGPAIELADDGPLTLTKQGVAVATVELTAAGAIVITAAPGQSVEAGGTASLAKYQQLVTAIDATLAALVAAGAGPAFTGAGTAQTAWNAAKAAIETVVTKGQ